LYPASIVISLLFIRYVGSSPFESGSHIVNT
jgi:hypothetical protein